MRAGWCVVLFLPWVCAFCRHLTCVPHVCVLSQARAGRLTSRTWQRSPAPVWLWTSAPACGTRSPPNRTQPAPRKKAGPSSQTSRASVGELWEGLWVDPALVVICLGCLACLLTLRSNVYEETCSLVKCSARRCTFPCLWPEVIIFDRFVFSSDSGPRCSSPVDSANNSSEGRSPQNQDKSSE